MNIKLISLLLIILIISLSGCVQNSNVITVPIHDLTQNSTYVGTFDGMNLYQFQINSINATCIGGVRASGTAAQSYVLDCKYN